MKWYRRISSSPNGDLEALGQAIDWFEDQILEARKEVSPTGRLWKASQMLPGMMEYRWGQLQELEAILAFFDILILKKTIERRKFFSEGYSKVLSDRVIEKYAEAEPEVIDLRLLHNEVALIRNKFLGITKALSELSYQISNLTRLKVAGMEDAQL